MGPGPDSRVFVETFNFDPIFTVLKDINLLKKYTKDQRLATILDQVFAVPKTLISILLIK